ncbi:MAG: N-acetylmuramoyl-L-alanine amidase [Pseudomonadota bacterium]
MKQKWNAAMAWIKSLFQKGSSGVVKGGEVVVEKPRPNQDELTPGDPKLIIPFAHYVNGGMGFKGTYKHGYPQGAIVHYTAGRFAGGLRKALDTMAGGKENGFTFLVISEDGEVVQGFPLDKWGWHAGQSSHPSFKGSASDKLIGIEICNGGLLERRGDKFFTWYGLEIPKDQVRHIATRTANQSVGFYHKYTDAQENALIHLLLWLKRNNPAVFNFDLVLGHDETTVLDSNRSRKQDPGGSLSMSMPEFRNHLKVLWNQEQKKKLS